MIKDLFSNLSMRKYILLGSLLAIISSFTITVSAHSGHPEDQLIDGIDNTILAYGIIFLALIGVVIVAFIQGKKAAAETKELPQ